MKRFLFACLFACAPAYATPYVVQQEESSLTFGGTHAGENFKGVFSRWTADIDFDMEAPEKSRVRVAIDTASATTGDTMRDGTLPTADWFDVKNAPQAVFNSTRVIKTEAGYVMEGTLNLRGKTQEVKIPFTLTQIKDKKIKASASFSLDRMAWGVGQKSDPHAEWVGRNITIEFAVVGTPKQ